MLWIALVAAACLSVRYLDAPMSSWIRHHKFSPTSKNAFRIIRLPGTFPFTIVVTIALAVALRRRFRDVIAPLVACGIASANAGLLKVLFGRHRPSAGDGPLAWIWFGARARDDFLPANLSFPSGDATLAFATATVLSVIHPRGAPLAFTLAAAAAIVRVCQGVHYPSDVLAGALVGTLTADLATRFSPRSFGRWDGGEARDHGRRRGGRAGQADSIERAARAPIE